MVIAVIREANRKRGLKPVKTENKASYLKEPRKCTIKRDNVYDR